MTEYRLTHIKHTSLGEGLFIWGSVKSIKRDNYTKDAKQRRWIRGLSLAIMIQTSNPHCLSPNLVTNLKYLLWGAVWRMIVPKWRKESERILWVTFYSEKKAAKLRQFNTWPTFWSHLVAGDSMWLGNQIRESRLKWKSLNK